MANFSDSGVQVHLNLNQAAEKKGFEPRRTSDSSDGDKSAAVMWSSCTLWTVFALGWVFAPCWWMGAAAGLRAGSDRQCLIKRKRGLSPAQSAAWWSNVVLTVLSAVALILVTTLYYGRRGVAQEGPFYLTLAGPVEAFPNMRDAANLAAVAKAVHAALNLGDDYPATNIAVWLQAQTTIAPVPVRHRHMLAAGSDQVAVLGYSLLVTEQLPAKAALAAMMDNSTVMETLAQTLADDGFVEKARLGLLSVRLESQAPSMLSTGDAVNVSPDTMVPIGRVDCKGLWTPVEECPVFALIRRHLLATRPARSVDTWADCGPGTNNGELTEMFNVTVQARAGGAPCNNTEGEQRTVSCEQPCPSGYCIIPPNASTLNINTTAKLRQACNCMWYNGATCGAVDVTCPDGTTQGSAVIKCVQGQYTVDVSCPPPP